MDKSSLYLPPLVLLSTPCIFKLWYQPQRLEDVFHFFVIVVTLDPMCQFCSLCISRLVILTQTSWEPQVQLLPESQCAMSFDRHDSYLGCCGTIMQELHLVPQQLHVELCLGACICLKRAQTDFPLEHQQILVVPVNHALAWSKFLR